MGDVTGMPGETVAIGPANPNQVAGSVWFDPTWILDPITGGNPPGQNDDMEPVQMQFAASGMAAGLADYSYSWTAHPTNPNKNQHAIIELAINLSVFGSGTTISSIQWAPSCGNDVINVLVPFNQTEVPEPASLSLALMGCLSLIGVRRVSRRPTA
jgi:hypothetical protein